MDYTSWLNTNFGEYKNAVFRTSYITKKTKMNSNANVCRGFAAHGECSNPYCLYDHPIELELQHTPVLTPYQNEEAQGYNDYIWNQFYPFGSTFQPYNYPSHSFYNQN